MDEWHKSFHLAFQVRSHPQLYKVNDKFNDATYESRDPWVCFGKYNAVLFIYKLKLHFPWKNGRCMTKTSYIHVNMKRMKALSFQIFITCYWHHWQSILQSKSTHRWTLDWIVELFSRSVRLKVFNTECKPQKNMFSWKKNQSLSFFFSQEMRCRWREQWARSKLPPWIGHMSITQLTQVDRPSLTLRIHTCLQPGGCLLIMSSESKRRDDFWAGGEHASSPQKQEFRILAGTRRWQS